MTLNNFLARSVTKNTASVLNNSIESHLANLNCVKIGIIQEYYPETRTAKVYLVNKRSNGITNDGLQITSEYPPIYPRIMFIGTVDNGMDYKLQLGDEVLVFFCDRELESWWNTGEISQLNSFRTHHMTDCIALAGIRSMPLTTITNDNLNIYSKNGIINFEGTVVINGDVTIHGNIEITGDATIGGISFLQHVHGNGNNGADTTAPKG